jgi:hypothetical protein
MHVTRTIEDGIAEIAADQAARREAVPAD